MEYQDTRGRLTKVTDANGHTSLYQEYDAANNLKQMTDASGAATGYAYDPANRLQTVTLSGGASVGYQWEADGLLKRISYSANQSRNYAYDNADRVATITNTVGSRNEHYSYGYDAHSNRLSEELKTDGSATALRRVDYEYDFGDRLKKATTGSQVTQWNYDGAGNRLSEVVTVGGTTSSSKTYSYDSLNRLRNVNGATFEYDANGNLTTQTAGLNVTSYEYDARDQMRRVLNGLNEQAQYDYDYERRRIGKTLNQGLSWREYVYDGSQVSAEYGRGVAENGGTQRDLLARYDYGTDLIRGQFGTASPTSLWYYSDALGSVTALSNSSGTIQTAYGYNAWGERTVGSDWGGVGSPLNNQNAVGYTGQFFDSETGLQPLGNGERYYSASLGRFTQQDSFSGVLGETASLNRYSYGHNNPIINTDPSGHIIPLIIAAVVVGAILGAAGGAAIGGGSEVIRQTAQKWDGTRTDYDWDQVGSAAKTGAAFGAAVGGLGAIPGFGQVLAAGLVGTMTVVGTYQGINSASDEFSQGHYWTGAVDTIFTAVGAVTGVRGVKGHWNNRSTGTTPALEMVKRWRGAGKTTPESVVERPQGAEVGKEPLLLNPAPEEVLQRGRANPIGEQGPFDVSPDGGTVSRTRGNQNPIGEQGPFITNTAGTTVGEITRLEHPGFLEFEGLEVRGARDLSHLPEGTLKAMSELGFAPKDAQGRRLILHHHEQNPNGPIIEIPAKNHSIGNRNQHPFGNTKGKGLTSEERKVFDQWRIEYWKARAREELERRGTK
jgi:RHS repeat-associated protein